MKEHISTANISVTAKQKCLDHMPVSSIMMHDYVDQIPIFVITCNQLIVINFTFSSSALDLIYKIPTAVLQT